jgi:hypothetical protein
MKKTNINILLSYLTVIVLFTTKLMAQQNPSKKLVKVNTTQINAQNKKVKIYKISAKKNDNHIFGYVTVEPVDTSTNKSKPTLKKTK